MKIGETVLAELVQRYPDKPASLSGTAWPNVWRAINSPALLRPPGGPEGFHEVAVVFDTPEEEAAAQTPHMARWRAKPWETMEQFIERVINARTTQNRVDEEIIIHERRGFWQRNVIESTAA